MTNYQHKKGNRIVKFALLTIIQDIMKTRAVAKFVWLDEGFENDSDRVHFTSGGHKCILAGVGCPEVLDDTLTGNLPVIVETEWEGKPNQRVDVTLNISDIHINSLEKIACEVYNSLWLPESDEDWEIVRQETVAQYLDTYLGK